MGIFGAMTTAISGLSAQSYSLERISDNIANSQTTAYKRSDATFADFVPLSPSTRQALSSVNAFSRPTNTVQGDIINSEVNTHIAVNGDGYFIIAEQIDTVDGLPVFSDRDLYTRRGDFAFDQNGYLVNSTGYYLQGLAIDPATGNPSGSTTDVIQISNDFLAANPTTQIGYRANLASYPRTAEADPTVPDSELLDPTDYVNDPTAGNDEFVQAVDVSQFIDQSVSGGAVTAYTATGASTNVQLRWAKTDTALTGGTDTWNLFYLEDSTATGANPAWRNIGVDYVFDTQGQLNPPISSSIITNLSVNGLNLGNINLNHGSLGVTQFADSNGIAKVTDINQDGYSAGELIDVAVTQKGRVTASYTNGLNVDLAEITLASFSGDNGLAKADGGAFRETIISGSPILGALGAVVGNALESSNTDIAEEFTKLIVTQQAYAANTRIISTADEMITEALNMIR